jgi:long-chain acyl-CoA synthetase
MDKPPLASCASNIPTEIDENFFSSISDMFNNAVATFQNRPALQNLNVVLTYRELDEKVNALAAYFQQVLQLQKNDRIAIMLPNCLQYVITMLAAFKVGLVVVNINPLYTARELIHQMNDAKPKAIVVLANVAHTLAEALEKIQVKHIIVTQLGDAFPALKSCLVNFVVKHIKKMVPRYSIDGTIPFRSALKKGQHLSLDPVAICGDDLAFLQYTGGTTGVAKGAMLSHRNMIANVEQAFAVISPVLSDDNATAVTPLPLYHIFSLMASCLVFIKAGVKNILITNPRDIPRFVRVLKENRVNALMAVNTLFNALLCNKQFTQLDFSNFRLVIAGGMALQKTISERWKKLTGLSIVEGYGLTEASPIVSIGSLETKKFTGSIGLPVPSTEVKVVDEQEKPLAIGEVGELCVRGPQVMQGYYNMPGETEQVIDKNGWLRTGDMARIDEKGFIYLVDRKKDMIDVAGFNVYPNEVEGVLASHPKVLEAAVIGVPNRITGESVKAFVVPKDKTLTKAELNAFCRKQLTSYKVPRRFAFCKTLPKTPVGKILRRVLKEPS